MQHTKLCQVLHGALAGSARGFQMFWAGIFPGIAHGCPGYCARLSLALHQDPQRLCGAPAGTE